MLPGTESRVLPKGSFPSPALGRAMSARAGDLVEAGATLTEAARQGGLVETRTARPVAASVLGSAGALLLAAEGALLILYPGHYSAPNLGGVGLTVGGLGVMAFAEAIVLIVVSAGAYLSPKSHLEFGVIMLTMAVLSLYTGGGFFLGALLGYVGGILAVFHDPAQVPVEPAHPPAKEVEAEEDPVVEADLIDSGLAAPASDVGDATSR